MTVDAGVWFARMPVTNMHTYVVFVESIVVLEPTFCGVFGVWGAGAPPFVVFRGLSRP